MNFSQDINKLPALEYVLQVASIFITFSDRPNYDMIVH